MDRVFKPKEQHFHCRTQHPSFGSIVVALYQESYCTERPDAKANGQTATRAAKYICISRSAESENCTPSCMHLFLRTLLHNLSQAAGVSIYKKDLQVKNLIKNRAISVRASPNDLCVCCGEKGHKKPEYRGQGQQLFYLWSEWTLACCVLIKTCWKSSTS